MATATKKARTATHASAAALARSEQVPMQLLIFEDNGGDYHWTLVDGNGNGLARSPSCVSYEHAVEAARVVLAGASSARLERRAATDGLAGIPVGGKVPMTAKDVDGAERRSSDPRGQARPQRRNSHSNM